MTSNSQTNPSNRSELVERIARMSAQTCGDFVTGEDGYVVFWPTENNGAFNSVNLRNIADELDRRNADWDVQVRTALGSASATEENG